MVGRCNDVVRACRDMNDVLAAVHEMTAAGIAPGESTYFAIMLDFAIMPVQAEDKKKKKTVGPFPELQCHPCAGGSTISFRRRSHARGGSEEDTRARVWLFGNAIRY